MFHPSSKPMAVGIFLALLLTVPVYAGKNYKISNYGKGHQIWFEAEDFDERNPNTDQYSPVVDQAGAFGKAVGRTGASGGMVRWTFDISAAGGKGGTWYFWGRVLNPNNRSDYLLVEGDPGDMPIPTGPPFPAGDGTAPFVNSDDQVFEETTPAWGWARSGHQGGHTKELKNGKNTMYIFRREGANATVFWDVFMWTDDPAYRPTDDDYRNAAVLLPGAASNASPSDGATDVPRDTATLSWTAGNFAGKHDVYFGTDVNAVTQATATADPAGVYRGRIDPTTYTIPPLAYGKTYYWRIDEVNKTPDNYIFKGTVWSFTVEPYGYPIKPAKATASSFQAGMGPEKTIDGSGLTGDLHGTNENTMWMTAGAQPHWIQYEFDAVYKLDSLQVWNSNQPVESFIGFGAKKVTIETSTDGTAWTPVANVPEFAQASGAPGYAANTTVNLGGAQAKYVKLTITANWGGAVPQTGLSEVRFFYVPVQARTPQPATAAKSIGINPSLNWRPGRGAASHKVYFGADANAVANGTVAAKTVTACSFSPGVLNLATTYYWRVDEVNAVTYPGSVWSFTTAAFDVVDDFESYTDKAGQEVYSAWIDGFENPAKNGAVVGLATAANGTFGDTTNFYGGKQSMPLTYDNTTAPLSEATLTLAPARDWTASGVKSLSLWFRGADKNTGQLYLKINSTRIPYNGDAGDLAKAVWTRWNVDLSTVTGGVSKVTKLAIGLEGAGAKGTLNVDEIRLYPTLFIPITQPVITKVVRANGQSGTRTDASPLTAYTGSTAPAPMPIYGLMDGAFVFSDRVFTWVNTPPALVGAEYILTFNQDKTAGETDVTYTVTLSRAATVFVGCDDRFSPNQQATVDHAVAAFAKPGQFKDTGLKLYYSDTTTLLSVSVFTADLPAGTYVFGSQEGNCFYTIGVLRK